ncbi:MAG: lysophospholipid acyltransferase family protein [Acidimicrobiales bacterium]
MGTAKPPKPTRATKPQGAAKGAGRPSSSSGRAPSVAAATTARRRESVTVVDVEDAPPDVPVDLPVDEVHSLALVPVAKDQPPGEADALRRSDVDEWGRSEHMRELARRLYGPMYESWHRVEWEGLDRIPTQGGALLVSNHAGAIPADAPAIMHGIETELGRPVYGLADEIFKRMPVVGTVWSRVGGVLAHPDNAYRLLREQQQLALVFPEGTKGTGKTFDERYQLRRFGRGGFVQIAMRAGVPVIPIAVVGAEEAMPILWKSPQLAKLLGIPYFPITANMFAFAPLGLLGAMVPLPAKIKIRVLEPVHFDVEPDQPRYSRSLIMDESEAIRQKIQEALFDMLRDRESVWFG